MTWLIIGGIFVLLCLLIFSHFRICFAYTDTLRVRVRFLCFRYTFLPKKPKKPRLQKYSTKHLLKLKRKRKKKQNQTVPKTGATAPATKPNRTPAQLLALVKEIYETFQEIPKKLIRYLKIRCGILRLTIGTDDAANTAILVGAATESVRALEAFITEQFRYERTARAEFAVIPDFLHPTCQAKVNLELRIRFWQAVALGVQTFFKWNQWNQKKQEKNKEAIQ